MIKKGFFLLVTITLLCLVSGCKEISGAIGLSGEEIDPQTGVKIGTPRPAPVPDEENTKSVGDTFHVVWGDEDEMAFTVNSVSFCSSFKEAGVDPTDRRTAFLVEQQSCLREDGELAESARFVLLEVTAAAVRSPDGTNGLSEGEHLINFWLTADDTQLGGSTVCYFEFAETPTVHRSERETDFYHYWLPQGESVDMRIGLMLPSRYYPEKSVYLTAYDDHNGGDNQFILLHKGVE